MRMVVTWLEWDSHYRSAAEVGGDFAARAGSDELHVHTRRRLANGRTRLRHPQDRNNPLIDG
jgi:hypothetical protein